MRLLSKVFALGAAPLLLAAQSPAPDPVAKALAATRPVNPIDKVICKKFPPPTGTRLRPRQICKTQVEWDLIRHEEQDALDRVQGRNATNGG